MDGRADQRRITVTKTRKAQLEAAGFEPDISAALVATADGPEGCGFARWGGSESRGKPLEHRATIRWLIVACDI